MVLTISRDDIKRAIIPRICCKKGCKSLTSTTRVRKTCDYHLTKSIAYRKDPEIREKQKAYMRNYYKNRRNQWSDYDWKKKKLDTVLKIQQIPYVKLLSISDDYETITLKLENLKPPSTLNNSPSALPLTQTLGDNPRIPKRNLGILSDTP